MFDESDQPTDLLFEKFPKFASVGADGIPSSEFDRDCSGAFPNRLVQLLKNDQLDAKGFYQFFCEARQLFDDNFRPFLTESDYVS